MADSKLHLSIVTPERHMVTDEVDQVNVPGTEGDMGILFDHSPLFSTLRPGQLSYEKDGEEIALVVSDGYIEVTSNRVTVLAETAEFLSGIDRERAEEARKKAEALIAKGDLEEEELREAQKKLFRALARLEHTQSN